MSTGSHRGNGQHRGEPQMWEAAVGRGEDCLKANARRYRVKARNPARAALTTLKRDNMSMVGAFDANLHIAVYRVENASGNPVAVFAIGGDLRSPQLIMRFARLQPEDVPLHRRGGPLDRDALHHEMPTAARRRAEEQLGFQGLRELITSDYWERELTLYCGTAAVLAAIGFPMSPGVFVVGAIILIFRGLIRLTSQEIRIQLRRRRIRHDPALQSVLSTSAVRRVFARQLNIPPETLKRRLSHTVLRDAATIPDITGEHALHLYVDEDSRIAVGGLRPAKLDTAVPAEDREITAEDLTHSDNILTVVFRRPKRRKHTQPSSAAQQAPPVDARPAHAEHGGQEKVDLDDLGAKSTPAKVDIDDLGGARAQHDHHDHPDDDEVVDAEVVEEERMYRR